VYLKQGMSLSLAVVLLVSVALAEEVGESPARSEAKAPRRALTVDARGQRLHDPTNSVDTLARDSSVPSASTPPAPPPLAPPRDKRAPSRRKHSPSLGQLIVTIGGMLLFMAGFFYLSIRLALWAGTLQEQPPRVSTLLPRSEELEPLEQRLKQVSASLVQVEQALLRQENAGLRVRFNQARKAEQNARQALERARKGIASRSAAMQRIDKAHKSAAAALVNARRLLGEHG
jgi:hypothetical protein